jgi:hypothetical protein
MIFLIWTPSKQILHAKQNVPVSPQNERAGVPHNRKLKAAFNHELRSRSILKSGSKIVFSRPASCDREAVESPRGSMNKRCFKN